MTVRRQRGATLGLAAACVLVVIVIGVGFFFLSKIIGGGREVANATDAGALNVAKLAVRRGALTLTGADKDEFGALCDTPDKLDLLSYNRIVAKAMIVCKNAADEGSAAATGNASVIHGQVNTLGNALRTALIAACAKSGGQLASDFTDISFKNNTKMWNGNQVNLANDITPGFMKEKSSSNVYFSAALTGALGGWSPAANAPNQKASTGDAYAAGYQEQKAGDQYFSLIPVFPGTRPHLVDVGNFTAAAPASITNGSPVLPNAFKTDAQAVESKSGVMGGSLACAIVGTLDKDFTASIPRGFVRISNGPNAQTVNSAHVPGLAPIANDGTNDIFNNELFYSPGIAMEQNSNVFSHASNGTQAMSTVGAYNATRGQFTYDPAINNIGGGDPVLWTGSTSVTTTATATGTATMATSYSGTSGGAQGVYSNPASFDLRSGGGLDQWAAATDLDGITSASPNIKTCTYLDYDITTPPYCTSQFLNWTNNYGRTTGTGGATNSTGFTNVEFMKADVLAQRAMGAGCAWSSAPNPSGVKSWGLDGAGDPLRPPYPNSKPRLAFPQGTGPKINFLAEGSPMQLLNEIGGCAKTTTIDTIVNRMRQVAPQISNIDSQVRAALSSNPLPLGTTTFLFANGNTIQMATSFPVGMDYLADATARSITPDGTGGAQATNCNVNYPLSGWVVDTDNRVTGQPKGDAMYHEVPFTSYGGSSATDAALWTPSSGYQNFLGELKFQETATGDTYCKPN